VETIMFGLGVWIYARATKPRDSIGTWAFVGVTAFLFTGFVGNANATPPPSVTALWMMALGLGALTLWLAWFADQHRRPFR
jgi:xanthine/uracil permease